MNPQFLKKRLVRSLKHCLLSGTVYGFAFVKDRLCYGEDLKELIRRIEAEYDSQNPINEVIIYHDDGEMDATVYMLNKHEVVRIGDAVLSKRTKAKYDKELVNRLTRDPNRKYFSSFHYVGEFQPRDPNTPTTIKIEA